jgi:uncharacterized cupin superfamily protein
VTRVNVASCKLDEELERGTFCHRQRHLESGSEAFPSGAPGAHTVRGPGRIVMFSVGALGWGEAFVTEYPDSDKIAAAPGVRFRRADAIDSWPEPAHQTPEPLNAAQQTAPGDASRVLNLLSIPAQGCAGAEPEENPRSRASELGSLLGARTWLATLRDLARGDATAPYHYSWCREEWTLVLNGAPTLRHSGGEDVLNPDELACFSEGPASAHQLVNRGESTARLITFSTPVDRPRSTFYRDDETVVIRVPGYKGSDFV